MASKGAKAGLRTSIAVSEFFAAPEAGRGSRLMLSPRAAARARSGRPAGGSRNRRDPRPASGAGFTLLEMLVALAISVLAATLLMPRIGDVGTLRVDGAARRFAEAVTLARERAILGGVPGEIVVDVEGGRWTAGEESASLPEGVRFRGAGESPVRVDLDPAGDVGAMRFELVDERGRSASVLLPAGGGRATVGR
jgi:prepilin-type N-terminal cleavage/methylation domain-containing protein